MPPPAGYVTFADLCRRAECSANTVRKHMRAMEADGVSMAPACVIGRSLLYTTRQAKAVAAYHAEHGGKRVVKGDSARAGVP